MDDHPEQKHRQHPHWLGGIAEAYADRNFRIYSIGSIFSWLSYFVLLVAVSWLTWALTNSTLWLAIMALLDIIPGVILLPFTGVFADRYDRHKIMIWVCILSFMQAAILAICSWLDMLSIFLLAVMVFIHSVLIAFMVPAMYGILPRFVAKPQLASAIAVSSSYVQIAIFAGPAFAGWIIKFHGVSWAFFVNAAGYFFLTIAFLALRTPQDYQQGSPEKGSVIQQIFNGASYLIHDRRILTLLILGITVNAITMATFHMLPAFSELILGMGVEGMSIILAIEGLGATAAALWIARGSGRLATTTHVIWSIPVAVISAAAMISSSGIYSAIFSLSC